MIFSGRGKELALTKYELIWHLQKSGAGSCNIIGWENKRFSLTPVSCTSCDWAGFFNWYWCDRAVVLLEIVTLAINNTFFFFFTKSYTTYGHASFFSLLIFPNKQINKPLLSETIQWHFRSNYENRSTWNGCTEKSSVTFWHRDFFPGVMAHNQPTLVQV